MKKLIIVLSIGSVLPAAVLLSGCKEEKNNNPIYPTDCGNYLTGTYAASDYCASTGQANYTCNIQAITPTNISLSNLGGIPVTALVDCDKNTINIPTQAVGNFSVSGSGTYTANRIVINWSSITSGISVNCSTTFTR